MELKNSPALLLLVTGAFLGLTFPLGRMAREASVSPIIWAWLIAAGTVAVLLPIHLLSGKRISFGWQSIKYFVLLSICSLVIPNVLIFTVIPKLGSGFTALLFTLSPIVTLALSSLWHVRVPSRLGIIGIAIGFVGTVIVTLTRGEISQPASFYWVLAGLCIPTSLAVGNLYRTMAWPKGAGAFELAIGTNLAAAILLFLLAGVFSQIAGVLDLFDVKALALTQVICAAIMFSVFFRLQQVGGPTYLSQIGYVAAGVALVIGMVVFEERYSLVTWIGAGVILIGICCSVLAQRRQAA